jgi:hypothetical protein
MPDGVEAGAAVLRARFHSSVEVSRADARDVLVASGYPAEVERLRAALEAVLAWVDYMDEETWAKVAAARRDGSEPVSRPRR